MAYGKIKMGKGPKKPDKSDAFVLEQKRKKPKPGFGINPPKKGPGYGIKPVPKPGKPTPIPGKKKPGLGINPPKKTRGY